jgi:multicomponent Na+:H+ antiporter subunit G
MNWAAVVPWTGTALIALGALLLLVAAYGVLMLPDALSRQHAATKAVTLAVALVCAGTALLAWDRGWALRLALITGFLVGSHLLARAAVREAGLDDEIAAAPWVRESDADQAKNSRG